MRRAKAHSVFSCQSLGMGKSLYSTPGYSRKGRWAGSTPRKTAEKARPPDNHHESLRVLMSGRVPSVSLVRHRVDHVIDADADAERRVLLRVFGIVGMLPGIAQVHIVADGGHEAALIVIDASPMCAPAGRAFFVGKAGAQENGAGHLVLVVEIVNRVEDLLGFGQVDNGTVGEDALHAGEEDVPFLVAVEVVAHEEAAAQKELAQRFGLAIGEIPVTHYDAVEPGPIVLEAFVEVDGLFDRAGLNAREAAQGLGEVPVGARVVHGPENAAAALSPVTAKAAAIPAIAGEGCVGIHQAGKGPLGFFPVVGRDGKIVVLERRVFAPGSLREHGSQEGRTACQQPHALANCHPAPPWIEDITEDGCRWPNAGGQGPYALS